jgi:hypothetical protein
MDMTILVQMGLAMGAVGFFVASYYRFSRPTRVNFSKDRRAPQLVSAAATPTADASDSRRLPSL